MAKFFTAGKTMRLIIIFITTILALSMTQCVSFDFSRRIVKQGNLIPVERINRLTLGMSKEDVAILMGTSLISPLFNNDRWDYAYTWRKGSGPIQIKHGVLYFSHGTLTRIEHRR